MIKISPLSLGEFKRASGLLEMQQEVLANAEPIAIGELAASSLSFWQHWLPCQMHISTSIYVAREDGNVLGVIALKGLNKKHSTYQVDSLVVDPAHRGRGLAQELLRYVFAQFGSQGVEQFMAEVPALNDAALKLFNTCGFCRSSLLTIYSFDHANSAAILDSSVDEGIFKRALPHHRQPLFQLCSEVLPPTLRKSMNFGPEDFEIREPVPFTSVERKHQKLMRTRVWYWISEDQERRVLTSALKVTAKPESGYKLEFFVHPGWKDLAGPLIRFGLGRLLSDVPQGQIWAKVYDFQPEIAEGLASYGFNRAGESFLLAREHWVRAKNLKRVSELAPIPQLPNPAINFPLAADRS